MKKLFTCFQVILTIQVIILLNANLFAQLSAPAANAVYGGRINAITGYGTSGTSSRIFIATESANSLFYADVTSTTTTPTFGNFTTVPDVNSNDNFGSAISQISTHSSSGYLFFVANGNLYKVNTTASSISTISSSGQVSSLLVYENYLFYIDGSNFVSKTLDVTGAVTATVSFAHGITGTTSIKVSPSNSKVYIGVISTTSPKLYKSSENYNALTGSSSFSSLSLGSMTASVTWNGFGIGPDGALFFGGDLSSTKYVNYSTSASDGAAWSGGTTALSGVSNSVFSFGGGASPYNVNYSKGHAMYTSGSGFTTSWTEFGNMGFETHPNDGPVFVDPTNSGIVYLTTDQGLGKSTDYGSHISEFDDGIEAVQVNDFSMNSGKTMAWLASKAGVRKVTDYNTTPVWTKAIFPNNDGSPYYSAEMENDNDATAYVGNLRVYKTTDSGLNWTQVLSEGSYPSFGTRVEAIEVCPTNSSLVLAGFYVDGATQGGLWYSTNAGTNWSQLQLRGTSTLPNDVDVYDIDFTSEGGIPVAYIGVEYDSTTSTRSVYRAEYNSGVWTTRQDFDGSYTAVGYAITATIMDVNVTGNFIYVCGTDAGSNHPIVYSRDYTAAYTTPAGKWTTLTTTGFPTSQVGTAVAVGGGIVNCAVSNIIYSIPETSGTTWTVGYTYPTGTQINVLFYDALLAGTGTGLYDHDYYGNLPVELTSFTASAMNNSVTLNWQTATEVNNYGFEIEKRITNYELGIRNWEKIGFVNGNGNSNSSKDYNFIEDNIASGKYLYRLKQIDNDGKFEYSKEIEVEVSTPLDFNLAQNYPNPFNPATTINFAIPGEANVTLAVFNQLGERVAVLVNEKLDAGYHSTTWNAGNMASGIYFYEIRTEKFISVKKLLLLK